MKIKKEPIAIIGMAGKMPGANDLQTFWSNIQSEKDGISEIPEDRWDWRTHYGESRESKSKVKWGGFLSDVDKFDARFFGISPKEAEYIDPQQRLFLETSWHTLEDAGYCPADLAGKRISVFVGVSTQDYRKLLNHPNAQMDPRITTGMSVSMLANRVSFLFNFTGPSDISDASCSSSLVAIHRGIRSIRDEGCEMALVGGVNLILIPEVMVAFDKSGMLSDEGVVRSFDQKAKGYVRGEGVGALLLKPLYQALEDHDSIYATIRGSAINHSGRGYSLTAPDLKGQTQVIVDAYQNAGISPETVSYLEAHGAATQAGDNIEVRAFKKAFAQLGHVDVEKKCKIGALKPNIGHLEAASGIASLFKVLLALKHQLKPGVKNLEKLNPLIKLQKSPFYITSTHEAWESKTNEKGDVQPRRAAIHSFGFSGVNAHLVLEEWVEPVDFFQPCIPTHKPVPCLVVLSAKNKDRLREIVLNLYHYVEQPLSLSDLAYTLQVGREAMNVRLGLLVNNQQELREKLAQWQSGHTSIPGVYFGNTEDSNQRYLDTSSVKNSSEDLEILAKHWVKGISIAWPDLYKSVTVQRLAGIPGYPFERQSCWISASASFEFHVEAISPEDSNGNLISFLKTVLRQVSGYQEVELSTDQTFVELGFDSLLLTEFINRLKYYFPLDLSFEVFIQQNTLEKLAAYLEHQITTDMLVDIPQEITQTPHSDRSPKSNTPPLAPLLDTYPVSAEQLRYWHQQQFTREGEHQSLSIPICLEIKKNLDVMILKKALQLVMDRQKVLRTVFQETSQGVRQQVLECFQPAVFVWEIAEGDTRTWQQTIDYFKNDKWDLTKGPLWRMGLIQQGKTTFLMLTMHHIIADLWSAQVFLNELSQLYHAWENSKANPLPLLSHQYLDYAYHEAVSHITEAQQEKQSYWQNLLTAPWEELMLPFKKEKKRQFKNKASLISRHLDDSLQEQVREFCKILSYTPFTLYLSALKLLLYGLSEQKRLIVGTSLQNRDHWEWEPLIGCFAEVSFSLLELDDTQTVLTLIEQVHDNILKIRKHALGFSETTAFLQKSRQDPSCPVVQVMFNYVRFPQAVNHLFDTDSRLIPLNRSSLDFDIAVTVYDGDEGCFLNIEYAENLFEAKTIERFSEQFENIFSCLMQTPEASVERVFEWGGLIRRKPVRIAATFTADPLKASLQYWMELLEEPIDITHAGFNQVFQELLDPGSLLRQNKRGVNVILLRLSDWCGASQHFLEMVDEWIEILQAALQASQTPYLVLICPGPPDQEQGFFSMMMEGEQKIKQAFQENQQVIVFNAEQIQQYYSVESIHHKELDQLGSIPYSDAYFNALGTLIARQCFGLWFAPYKVLVVDGDHTLWQGTVGEDGVDGIGLDAGRYKFQQRLVTLQKSGVLLCLCSKNVEEDIHAIFEKHADFPLKAKHFVALKANWQTKSSNLKTLASELNLSLDSFLFIDDNPLEIAEVSAQCPEVRCLHFPQEVDQIETFVDHIWFLDQRSQTREDGTRTQWYQQNLKREHVKASAPSYAEFIKNLDLEIEIGPMTPEQVGRVSQLTQRTNQFNSTTVRRSEQSVQELAEQSNIQIEQVEVKDRFGDYGLVGVMFLRFTPEKAIIESLIVSCRVLGRGVEHAMLSKAGKIALDRGLKLVDIRYCPSARNAPILNFLKSIQDIVIDKSFFKIPLAPFEKKGELQEKTVLGHHTRCETGFSSPPLEVAIPVNCQCEKDAEDGFCLTLSSRHLLGVRFDPEQFVSHEIQSLPLQNNFPETHIPNDRASEWEAYWMAYSDMNLLTQKIAETQKTRVVLERKFVTPSTETEQTLALIWQDILMIHSVGVETPFFELGGTSLELVQVFSKTRETFAVPLSLQIFSDNSTIRCIAQQIENYRKTGQFLQTNWGNFPDLNEEARLPEAIRNQINCLLENAKEVFMIEQEKVLLTGSTGFLGAYLLKNLLEKTPYVICCLVRAKDAVSGLERIQKNLALYNLKIDTSRIEVVIGDLSQKNLGITDEEYNRLSKEISKVYHNGALVNFILPYDRLKSVNVRGAQECLRFACTNRLKPFHYVSTVSIFDSGEYRSTECLKEKPLDCESYRVHGGYAQSKWAAEMMLTQAGEAGLPISIYRPNGIGPSLDPNHTRFNTDDAFSLVLLASISIRKFFDLTINIDFTPVDYVASAIVALSDIPATGQIYSMTNPKPQTLVKVQEELKQLGEEVELIPYASWVSALKEYAETVDNQKLLMILPLLQDAMPSFGETWFELSARRPQFDCTNTLRDLQGLDVPSPAINTDNIMKLLLLSFLTNNYLECTNTIKPYPTTGVYHSLLLDVEKTIHCNNKVIILTWSLGSGHNTAAQAIKSTLKKEKRCDAEIVDLGDWISFVRNLEPFWAYLSRNNIAQLKTYTAVMQASRQHEIPQFKKIYEVTVQRLIEHYDPQTIVSVCPLGCQLLRYFKEISQKIKTVTYVSDWFGGNFKDWGDAGADWIYSPSEECTQFLIETFKQSQSHISQKITTGSLITGSGFSHSLTECDQNRLRKKWGIEKTEKVLLFNSYGMESLVKLLKRVPLDSLQLRVMVMCYNNEEVLKAVNELEADFPGKIEGRLWLDNVNEWLLISDVLFSKPGPGICAEALMTDTVIFLNALEGIMPQEVSVYQKLLVDNLGFGIESETDFINALESCLNSDFKYREILHNVQHQHFQDGCEEFCGQILKQFAQEEVTC